MTESYKIVLKGRVQDRKSVESYLESRFLDLADLADSKAEVSVPSIIYVSYNGLDGNMHVYVGKSRSHMEKVGSIQSAKNYEADMLHYNCQLELETLESAANRGNPDVAERACAKLTEIGCRVDSNQIKALLDKAYLGTPDECFKKARTYLYRPEVYGRHDYEFYENCNIAEHVLKSAEEYAAKTGLPIKDNLEEIRDEITELQRDRWLRKQKINSSQ